MKNDSMSFIGAMSLRFKIEEYWAKPSKARLFNPPVVRVEKTVIRNKPRYFVRSNMVDGYPTKKLEAM